MKPAFSVLVFTVSSGAGYGLILWMLHFQLFDHHNINLSELFIGGLIGLSLITLGLLSSTLHLANPKNAWRSFSRFRTSWLSREGVFAVLFYPAFLAYGLVLWSNNGVMTLGTTLLGYTAAAIALTIVFCTGMIYASLKPIRQWHNPLTAPLYLMFSLMSGCLLYTLLNLVLFGELSEVLLGCFAALVVLTGISKWAYFALIGKPEGSTINSATNLGRIESASTTAPNVNAPYRGRSRAQVRLLDAGHNSDTFLTKEFVFDVAAVKLLKLRRLMFLCVFIIPVLSMIIAWHTQSNLMAYFVIVPAFAGLLIERWLFFAEARHTVRLYHGDQRV